MYRDLQIIALIVLGMVMGLPALGRRFPDVEWLQVFARLLPELPEPQRRRARRQYEMLDGIKFILVGLGVPLGYVFLTALTFGEFTAGWIAAVTATSVACISLGVAAIRSSRRG